MVTDFFDQYVDDFRDHYGRPRIVPKGMPKTVRVPYTRASSFADRVDDQRHIHRWEQRYLARAMADPANEDLRELASAEIYTTGYEMEDIEKNRASGRNLDGIVTRALDRQGIHRRADQGTAIHGFIEQRWRIDGAPAHLKPRIESFWECVDREGIKILATEQFTANDEVQSAGTFDQILWHPKYDVCIGDAKTGKISEGFAVQTAIYAYGELYDPETHDRAPLESLTEGEFVNTEEAILFHIGEPDETGKCHTDIVVVDLLAGWQVAKAIKVVADSLTSKVFTREVPSTLTQQIARQTTVEGLEELWRRTKDQWLDKHREAAKRQRTWIEEAS